MRNARFSRSKKETFMNVESDLVTTIRRLRSVESRLDALEDNQRNAESGTTDCSSRQDAALSTENRAFQPAGFPLGLIEEYEQWLKAEYESAIHAVEVHRSDKWRFYRDGISLCYERLRELRSQGGC